MYKSIHMIAIVVLGIVSTMYYLIVGADWQWWLAAIVMNFVFGCLGVTVTFHRYLTHKSFEFRYSWIERLFSLFGLLGATGSPLGWVGLHKTHHKYADTTKDGHGPVRGWRNFFPDYDYFVSYKDVRYMFKDPYHKFLHNYGAWVIVLYLGVLYLVGGFQTMAFFGLIPQLITGGMSSICNWFTHWKLGYRNYDVPDDSVNVWWLAIPTWGEAWHNNHHAEPWTASFQRKWWEVDISALVIKLVSK